MKFFGFVGEIFLSHTAWVPEGCERQSQAYSMGPKPVRIRVGVGPGSRVGGPGSGPRSGSGGPPVRAAGLEVGAQQTLDFYLLYFSSSYFDKAGLFSWRCFLSFNGFPNKGSSGWKDNKHKTLFYNFWQEAENKSVYALVVEKKTRMSWENGCAPTYVVWVGELD